MERMKLPPGQRTKEDMSHNIVHRRGWAEDMSPIFGTAVDTEDIIRNHSTGAAAFSKSCTAAAAAELPKAQGRRA